MAGLGVLARLTQAASAERVAEQNFRSSLFAQGRQEILASRQVRLAESEAIGNRIERGIERQDKKDAAVKAEQLERDKIASREKIAGIRSAGGGGGIGPIIPPLPQIGEGFDNRTLGGGLLPGTQSAEDVAKSGATANVDFTKFDPKNETDNKTVRTARTTLAQSIITGNSEIDRIKLAVPKDVRFKGEAGREDFKIAKLAHTAQLDDATRALAQLERQKKAADDVVLWEPDKLSQADPRDVAALTKAKNDQIKFNIALQFLRSKGRPDMKVQVEGQGLLNEEQLINVISGAERQEQLLQSRINAFSPLSTKPPAITGGAKGLERAASEGNLNAQKANNILLGN